MKTYKFDVIEKFKKVRKVYGRKLAAMNNTLTRKNVNEFVGCVIKWSAPAGSGNPPYGGTAFIAGIDSSGEITAKTIEGDDLSYAFLVEGYDEYFYSDADRCIVVKDILQRGLNLNERVFYTFVNDNEPSMNILSDSEEKIRLFIETNFECEWESIKDIENVTCFNAGNGSIDDFWGEPFIILL